MRGTQNTGSSDGIWQLIHIHPRGICRNDTQSCLGTEAPAKKQMRLFRLLSQMLSLFLYSTSLTISHYASANIQTVSTSV